MIDIYQKIMELANQLYIQPQCILTQKNWRGTCERTWRFYHDEVPLYDGVPMPDIKAYNWLFKMNKDLKNGQTGLEKEENFIRKAARQKGLRAACRTWAVPFNNIPGSNEYIYYMSDFSLRRWWFADKYGVLLSEKNGLFGAGAMLWLLRH